MRDDQLIVVLLSLEHTCVKPAVEHFEQSNFSFLIISTVLSFLLLVGSTSVHPKAGWTVWRSSSLMEQTSVLQMVQVGYFIVELMLLCNCV